MAFPTTSVIDDFNRGSLGSNWTNLFGTLSISSNQLAGQSSGAVGYYNAAQYGPNAEVYAFITALPATGEVIELGARAKEMNLATVDGYSARVTRGSGSSATWVINRLDNGSLTPLATTSDTIQAGDGIGLEVIGSSLRLMRFRSGAWSELLSTTDSTYSNAGFLTVTIVSSGARLDNFGGGTVTVEDVVVSVSADSIPVVSPAAVASAAAASDVSAQAGVLTSPSANAIGAAVVLASAQPVTFVSVPVSVNGDAAVFADVQVAALVSPALAAAGSAVVPVDVDGAALTSPFVGVSGDAGIMLNAQLGSLASPSVGISGDAVVLVRDHPLSVMVTNWQAIVPVDDTGYPPIITRPVIVDLHVPVVLVDLTVAHVLVDPAAAIAVRLHLQSLQVSMTVTPLVVDCEL